MKLIYNNKAPWFFLISVLILLIGLISLSILKKKEIGISSVESVTELFNHPIYSNYEFDQGDSIINIGIQPLMPSGIIFEVIKRDNILNKSLSASGKKIEYYSFLKGADINFFLQQKMLDGGVGGDMPALSISSVFDVAIPIIVQKGKASIVSARPMLTDDFKGKRIAYPYESISHYFILELLQSAGIAENQVRLIPMDVSSMAKALHNNEIDLFSAWEPNVASALKQYPEFFITYQQITTGYLYFSKAYTQENPEIVNHILAAVIRSISWMKSDRENLLLACEWNIMAMDKSTKEKSVLNAEEMANLALHDILGYYSKYSIVLNSKDVNLRRSLQNEYEFIKTLNTGKENKHWDEVVKNFDSKVVTEILNHPKKFRLNEYNYIISK
ncbi:MAG: ABC transporter substrate-binding protein [Bacteroidales bacterium]|nr:ABC transporter substrate-binding protein [Bacteroidales bacterium]